MAVSGHHVVRASGRQGVRGGASGRRQGRRDQRTTCGSQRRRRASGRSCRARPVRPEGRQCITDLLERDQPARATRRAGGGHQRVEVPAGRRPRGWASGPGESHAPAHALRTSSATGVPGSSATSPSGRSAGWPPAPPLTVRQVRRRRSGKRGEGGTTPSSPREAGSPAVDGAPATQSQQQWMASQGRPGDRPRPAPPLRSPSVSTNGRRAGPRPHRPAAARGRASRSARQHQRGALGAAHLRAAQTCCARWQRQDQAAAAASGRGDADGAVGRGGVRRGRGVHARPRGSVTAVMQDASTA